MAEKPLVSKVHDQLDKLEMDTRKAIKEKPENGKFLVDEFTKRTNDIGIDGLTDDQKKEFKQAVDKKVKDLTALVKSLTEKKNMSRKNLKEGRKPTDSYRGCDYVKVIWNGAYSDPELYYRDDDGEEYYANYWEVDDYMFDAYESEHDYAQKHNDDWAKEMNSKFDWSSLDDTDNDEDFSKFVADQEDRVIGFIIDLNSNLGDDDFDESLKNKKPMKENRGNKMSRKKTVMEAVDEVGKDKNVTGQDVPMGTGKAGDMCDCVHAEVDVTFADAVNQDKENRERMGKMWKDMENDAKDITPKDPERPMKEKNMFTEKLTLDESLFEAVEDEPKKAFGKNARKKLGESSKRDDIDAKRDNRVERARARFNKVRDDADAQRDDRLKKSGLKESLYHAGNVIASTDFKHTPYKNYQYVFLNVDGREAKGIATYINRPWERYDYESALHDAMRKLNLPESAFNAIRDAYGIDDAIKRLAASLGEGGMNESKKRRMREMFEPISSFKDFTFAKKTNQGWEVKKLFRDAEDDRMHAIVYRPKRNDYLVALGYSPESGTWNQGRYDFTSFEDAVASLKRDYQVEPFVLRESLKTPVLKEGLIDEQPMYIRYWVSEVDNVLDNILDDEEEKARIGLDKLPADKMDAMKIAVANRVCESDYLWETINDEIYDYVKEYCQEAGGMQEGLGSMVAGAVVNAGVNAIGNAVSGLIDNADQPIEEDKCDGKDCRQIKRVSPRKLKEGWDELEMTVEDVCDELEAEVKKQFPDFDGHVYFDDSRAWSLYIDGAKIGLPVRKFGAYRNYLGGGVRGGIEHNGRTQDGTVELGNKFADGLRRIEDAYNSGFDGPEWDMPTGVLTDDKKARRGGKKLTEAPVYGLTPQYDARQSFYGKAQVDTGDKGDKNKLYSYDTLVAEMKDGKPVVYGTFSATTLRHIKEWLKQNGFKAENAKQIMADYGAKK